MNWDRIKGNWNQMKGRAKRKWGKVTDDDTTIFTGQRIQLAGKLREGYGVGKENVQKAVDKLTDAIKS
jgi:uncharacterized protein YjbJ (UPF0337 family)